jgi:hypothetical protein
MVVTVVVVVTMIPIMLRGVSVRVIWSRGSFLASRPFKFAHFECRPVSPTRGKGADRHPQDIGDPKILLSGAITDFLNLHRRERTGPVAEAPEHKGTGGGKELWAIFGRINWNVATPEEF